MIFIIFGVGLGVEGVILGMVLVEFIIVGGMMWYFCCCLFMLRLFGEWGSFLFWKEILSKVFCIFLLMGFEYMVICGV